MRGATWKDASRGPGEGGNTGGGSADPVSPQNFPPAARERGREWDGGPDGGDAVHSRAEPRRAGASRGPSRAEPSRAEPSGGARCGQSGAGHSPPGTAALPGAAGVGVRSISAVVSWCSFVGSLRVGALLPGPEPEAGGKGAGARGTWHFFTGMRVAVVAGAG